MGDANKFCWFWSGFHPLAGEKKGNRLKEEEMEVY